MSDITNTGELRKILIGTLEQVRKGKLDHRQASAISGISGQILRSAEFEFKVAKSYGKGNKETVVIDSVDLVSTQKARSKAKRIK